LRHALAGLVGEALDALAARCVTFGIGVIADASLVSTVVVRTGTARLAGLARLDIAAKAFAAFSAVHHGLTGAMLIRTGIRERHRSVARAGHAGNEVATGAGPGIPGIACGETAGSAVREITALLMRRATAALTRHRPRVDRCVGAGIGWWRIVLVVATSE
jgi:hypothetical protein